MKLSFNPVQRLIWLDPVRRGRNLLRFAEVEADGGRDLARAAEVTGDPRLRRLYLRHALDEQRHANIFRERGIQLLVAAAPTHKQSGGADWLTPGERGLDDVSVKPGSDGPLLAFLHLSEREAARRFEIYGAAVGDDVETRDVFARILKDEAFHMNYTRHELSRVEPKKQGWMLWRARLGRLWKGYLRFAVALGSLFGAILLTVQYFLLLPLFALVAKRAARRDPPGWFIRDGSASNRIDAEF